MLAFAILLIHLEQLLFTSYLYNISTIMQLEVEIREKKQVFNNLVKCFNFTLTCYVK